MWEGLYVIKSPDTWATKNVITGVPSAFDPTFTYYINLLSNHLHFFQWLTNKRLNDHLSEVCLGLAQIWCICLENRQYGVSNDCTCEPDTWRRVLIDGSLKQKSIYHYLLIQLYEDTGVSQNLGRRLLRI